MWKLFPLPVLHFNHSLERGGWSPPSISSLKTVVDEGSKDRRSCVCIFVRFPPHHPLPSPWGKFIVCLASKTRRSLYILDIKSSQASGVWYIKVKSLEWKKGSFITDGPGNIKDCRLLFIRCTSEMLVARLWIRDEREGTAEWEACVWRCVLNLLRRYRRSFTYIGIILTWRFIALVRNMFTPLVILCFSVACMLFFFPGCVTSTVFIYLKCLLVL